MSPHHLASLRSSTGTAALAAPPTPRSVLTPAYAASASSMTSSGPGSPLIAAGRYPTGLSPFESPRLGVDSQVPNAAQQPVSGATHAAQHPANRIAHAAQSAVSSSDQLVDKPSKWQQAREHKQLGSRGLSMLQKQEARMLQYRQGEEAERRTAGKHAAASASKPAVVQPLPVVPQTSAVAEDSKEVAEVGQGDGTDGDAQADKPPSKAEKARLARELTHRRKARAKEAKAAARAADATAVATADAAADPTADAADEQVAEQAAGNKADEVGGRGNEHAAEDEGHFPPAEQGSPEDHHAFDDPQQVEDADAVQDEVDENAPHTASSDMAENAAVKNLVEDETMPYAVMAAGSVFVAGTIVMGAWCAAVTSPVWVPRVAWKCSKAAWSWRSKKINS